MRYAKSTPRLTVKFINSDTNDILFEVKDRTWMTVGDLLNDVNVSSIMRNEYKDVHPDNLMVLVVAEYELND